VANNNTRDIRRERPISHDAESRRLSWSGEALTIDCQSVANRLP
jgi:hypothetical protein